MKNILLSIALLGTLSIAGEQFSMSDADRKMYADMKENNPADMDISAGEELFVDEMGDEEALAEFLGIQEKELAQYIAGFPRYVKKLGNVVGIGQVLQALQTEQGKTKDALDSSNMYALIGYVKSLANDEEVNIDVNENDQMKASYKMGKELYETPRGGRGLSCLSCHSVPGTILRTQPLPDLGEIATGGTWPAYRMTTSEMITMQKRSQGCMEDAMQAPLPLGSKEMIALEVYITSLAKEKKKKIAIPGLKR